MIDAMERENRVASICSMMERLGLRAILAIGNSCVGTNAYGCFRYLTDIRVYYHLASAVLFPDGRAIGVVADEAAREEASSGFVREFVLAEDPPEAILRLLRENGVEEGAVGTCLELLPVSWAMRLREALPGIVLTDVSEEVFRLRNLHSREEVDRIVRAGALADAGYEAVLRCARAGMTEQELAAEIEYATQKMGGDYNFTLVSTGAFSLTDNRLPVIRAATMINRRLEPGDAIAMEITPRYEGYWAQLVRTVSVGPANEDLKTMHRACVDVIDRTLPELYPGNRIGNIAARVREATEAAGYIFRLPCGHICGLDLNEERLSEDNDRLLEKGMAVILHPSIVTPQIQNGIFWGQTYLITADGYRSLTSMDDGLKCV